MAIYGGLGWGAGTPERPFVAVNMVSTVDGKITLDHNRFREPIGSRTDRDLMVRLRGGADAVIRGAGTVRAYPYYPKTDEGAVAARRSAGLPDHPLAVVVSASCDLPWDSPFFQGAPRKPIVFTSRQADPRRVEEASRWAHVEVVGSPGEPGAPPAADGGDGEAAGGAVPLPALLQRLKDGYGVQRLLLEGGPHLNWLFFRHHAVDELFWTVAPKIAGKETDLTMVAGPGLLLPLRRLQLLSVFLQRDELFLRYRVLPPAE